MMQFMQKLAKCLMIPIAVLPVASLFVGVSSWTKLIEGEHGIFSVLLFQTGSIVLSCLPVLFAVSISVGMIKKQDGVAAVSGLLSYLVITSLCAPETIAEITGIEIDSIDPAYEHMENVFVGILAGLIAAACFNRFHNVKLPNWISFFSGRRCVAIVTTIVSALVATVFSYIWQIIFTGLVDFGVFIQGLGPVGSGLYGAAGRLLIPFGLHHALNSVFWFDIINISDVTHFLNQDGVFGVTGQYMTGFFPIMIFGLPAAALAMYHCAETKNRKTVYGLLLAAALSSIVTGVTEPIEFLFIFIAPPLFAIHAVFTGLSMAICYILPMRTGFSFSAGILEVALNWNNAMNENVWLIFPVGAVFFVLYYFTFRFAIKKFNLMTVGRGTNTIQVDDGDTFMGLAPVENADKILESLGGKKNVLDLDNCVTRLRLQVDDPSIIDESALAKLGAYGVSKFGKNSVQVVFGPNVQFIAEAIGDIMNEDDREPSESKAEAVDVSTVSKAINEVQRVNLAPGEDNPEVAAAKAARKQAAKLKNSPVEDLSASEPEESAAEVSAAVDAPDGATSLKFPVKGERLELSQVPDPTFSSEMLGKTLAVMPSSGDVFAPSSGEIKSIFRTKHAITLLSDSGHEILIHFGIDTVELEGAPFTIHVSQGDKIASGDLLMQADLAQIEAAGKSPIVTMVVMNESEAGAVVFG